MTDDKYLRALIADTREAQRAYQTPRREWHEEEIRQVVTGNAEIERLTSGRVNIMDTTTTPPQRSEVDRLSNLLP